MLITFVTLNGPVNKKIPALMSKSDHVANYLSFNIVF